jgi:phage/plasmid-like protein (TIGR03299 family)
MVQCTKTWDGKIVNIPGRFSTTRTTDGKDLGIVSADYKVYQNREAFNFLNTITDTGSQEAAFSTAGSLFGGSRIFITLKIGEGFTVGDQDAHDLYLTAVNSHDGNKALEAYVTPIRAVCNNTVTLGLKQARTRWSLRHKTDLSGKVHEAREALEMAFHYEDAFAEEVNRLIDIEITKEKFHQIAEKIIPASKRQHDKDVELLMDIWENEDTVLMGGGERFGKKNGWSAFNAVTFFTDNTKTYRTPESRFNSIIGSGVGTGLGEKLRPAAHKAILAFA